MSANYYSGHMPKVSHCLSLCYQWTGASELSEVISEVISPGLELMAIKASMLMAGQ